MAVKLSPLWKQAVTELLMLKPQSGYLITHKWLDEQFGLEAPNGQTTRKATNKYDFDFMSSMGGFRTALLENHSIALRTITGRGYEILPPSEQTKFAMREGARAIAKSFNKMEALTTYVDHEKLTVAERKENTDALARLAMMRSMYQRGKTMKIAEGPKQIESYV